MGNDLNSDIVLGLVILIITLLAVPRFLTNKIAMLIPWVYEIYIPIFSVPIFELFVGLVILIMTLLALPRFQPVYLVLKLLFEAVQTLFRIVVLLQRLIWDLHQIISMAHDGFQQVLSVLELIDDVVGSLVRLVDLLRQLRRTCRGIWAIWTARQPTAVANDHQNEVPPTDTEADAANGQNDAIVNEESNI